jgi:hypothetical protein
MAAELATPAAMLRHGGLRNDGCERFGRVGQLASLDE